MPGDSKEAIDTVSTPADDNDFGANEWLVEEQYQLFLKDKDSVAKSWWPILERYGAQRGAGGAATSMSESSKPAPAQPAADAPAADAPEPQPSSAPARIEAVQDISPRQCKSTHSL